MTILFLASAVTSHQHCGYKFGFDHDVAVAAGACSAPAGACSAPAGACSAPAAAGSAPAGAGYMPPQAVCAQLFAAILL